MSQSGTISEAQRRDLVDRALVHFGFRGLGHNEDATKELVHLRRNSVRECDVIVLNVLLWLSQVPTR